MSLVAYDYSSDEESDQEDTDVAMQVDAPLRENVPITVQKQNGIFPEKALDRDESTESEASTAHLPLPAPKKVTNGLNVEEDDDEFLRKKEVPEAKPQPMNMARVKNRKVQITIPSLKDFKDDEDSKPKQKPIIGAELPRKVTGLLGLLPKPKSEMAFAAPTASTSSSTVVSKPVVNRLIPDSVANRSKSQQVQKTTAKKSLAKRVENAKPTAGDDSEGSGDEDKIDFFSLNTQEELPDISSNEINALVAKRAAQMAEAAKRFDEPEPLLEEPGSSGIQPIAVSSAQEDDLANEQALSSLIGGNRAKRARLDDVNIIDISSDDIVPSKADFLRRKLQDETGYVPTGHLTGDWTCTSKRKSHITYLASKAQANSQELEAMWSSNRQSRRQTQSKYGF